MDGERERGGAVGVAIGSAGGGVANRAAGADDALHAPEIVADDGGGGQRDGAGLQRLLESLEQLAQHHAKAEPVEDAESLKRAIEDADSGFAQAMDLRRALEDAFKTRLP